MLLVETIYIGLAVAAITMTICEAEITRGLRERFNPWHLLDCTFCTSFWVSAGVTITDFSLIRCFALMTVASLGIFVIRLSTATVEYEDE